jgi:hypothetical protein
LKKIEILAILTVVIGVTFKILHWQYGNELLLLGVGVLCIIDMFGSHLLYEGIGLRQWLKDKSVLEKDAYKSTVFRLCGTALTLIWLGLLFNLFIWVGSREFITYGLLAGLVALGLILAKFKTKDTAYYQAAVRLIPMLLLASLFYLKPNVWIDYHYDHDHQARDLLREMNANPGDTVISNRFEERMSFYIDSCNNSYSTHD